MKNIEGLSKSPGTGHIFLMVCLYKGRNSYAGFNLVSSIVTTPWRFYKRSCGNTIFQKDRWDYKLFDCIWFLCVLLPGILGTYTAPVSRTTKRSGSLAIDPLRKSYRKPWFSY